MDRAQQFRAAAERHNEDRGRTGWRYPPEIRTLAMEHCQEQREIGRAYSKIAAELGITGASLSRWLEEENPAPAHSFLPVQILEPPEANEPVSGTLNVVTPNGLRIEGLVWSQTLELVRVFG